MLKLCSPHKAGRVLMELRDIFVEAIANGAAETNPAAHVKAIQLGPAQAADPRDLAIDVRAGRGPPPSAVGAADAAAGPAHGEAAPADLRR